VEKASTSKRPIGPFHSTVCADCTMRENSSCVLGPDVHAHHVGGNSVKGHDFGSGVLRVAVGDEEVERQIQIVPVRFGLLDERFGGRRVFRFEVARADFVTRLRSRMHTPSPRR
jgi:hypothetical protein